MNNIILYTDNGNFTSYKENHVFTIINDTTCYFITEVKEN